LPAVPAVSDERMYLGAFHQVGQRFGEQLPVV
jgi:hypothetical protein